MQGKLINAVVLPREIDHFYPQAVFSDAKIHEPQITLSQSLEEPEVSVKKLTSTKEKDLITKWIKDRNG